jgi:hypothetical protein
MAVVVEGEEEEAAVVVAIAHAARLLPELAPA